MATTTLFVPADMAVLESGWAVSEVKHLSSPHAGVCFQRAAFFLCFTWTTSKVLQQRQGKSSVGSLTHRSLCCGEFLTSTPKSNEFWLCGTCEELTVVPLRSPRVMDIVKNGDVHKPKARQEWLDCLNSRTDVLTAELWAAELQIHLAQAVRGECIE